MLIVPARVPLAAWLVLDEFTALSIMLSLVVAMPPFWSWTETVTEKVLPTVTLDGGCKVNTRCLTIGVVEVEAVWVSVPKLVVLVKPANEPELKVILPLAKVVVEVALTFKGMAGPIVMSPADEVAVDRTFTVK